MPETTITCMQDAALPGSLLENGHRATMNPQGTQELACQDPAYRLCYFLPLMTQLCQERERSPFSGHGEPISRNQRELSISDGPLEQLNEGARFG
jgi:hypothetical protein